MSAEKRREPHRENNGQRRSAMKSRKKKKLQRRRRRLRIIFALELLLIVVLVVGAAGIYQLGRIQTCTVDLEGIRVNDVNDANMKDYETFVVFGVDSRANELDKNTRSDSIILVSINKKTKETRLLSVYRDTYVNVEEHGYTKMTHAYAYGGPELAISTLNTNFDLNIQNFVTVNFSAVTNLVDKVGGVEIDIKEEELKYVNSYAKDVAKINGTKYHKLKKAGVQTLDGTQATGYCRVRYTSGGDFTRAERQRTVLLGVFEKMKKSSPVVWYQVADEMMPQIYTSYTSKEIIRMGTWFPSLDITESHGFPFDKETPTINRMSVVTAEDLSSNVTKMHEYLYGTKDYVPTGTVQSYSNEIAARH